MKKYLYGGLFALLMLGAGCYKDTGNYDLTEINRLVFKTSAPDTLRLKLFERIRIDMAVEQTQGGSEADLEYNWRIFEFPNGAVTIPLGNKKNLDTMVTLNPAMHKLVLSVKDRKTGVTTMKEFLVDITSALSEGWVLLEDDNGKKDLSMLTPAKEILRNIYSIANGEFLPAASRKVKIANVAAGAQEVYVYGGNDGVMVSYINFLRQYRYADWFFGAPGVAAPQAVFYNKLGVSGFVVNDGKLHSVDFFYSGPKKFGAPIDGDWYISGQVLPMFNSDLTMLWDSRYQRFLKHENNKINALVSLEGSAFELNNVGKELVYAGPGNNDFYNCLMKDNGINKFYVYRVNTSGNIIADSKYDLTDAPGIERAKYYASSETYLQLYYTVDNKIYLIDIPAGKARLVYAFPAGEEITALRMKQSQSNLIIFYPDNNRLITAATWNGTEGKFYHFPISNTGDFSGGAYNAVYSGFDKIIDIDYKNKK